MFCLQTPVYLCKHKINIKHLYIFGKIFIKIRQFLREVAKRQTDRQTDRQTPGKTTLLAEVTKMYDIMLIVNRRPSSRPMLWQTRNK